MIIKGPAAIQRNGIFLYVHGDIIATPVRTTVAQQVDSVGFNDEREGSFKWEIGFTPAGIASAGYFDELYPAAYRTPVVGTDIFGSADVPLVLWTFDGQKITFNRSALTKMPDLNLAADKQLFGAATYTALGTLEEDLDTAGRFAEIQAAAFADTSFDPSKILTLIYSAAWGASAPWTAIASASGFTFAFELALAEEPSDKYGIAGMTIAAGGLTVSGKCQPQGITAAQILAAMAPNKRGQSIYSGTGKANTLALTTAVVGEPFFNLFNSALKILPLQAGAEVNRNGEVEFVATTNRYTAGALQPVFEIGLTPEPEAEPEA
jgi:hypothetical protein